MHKVRNRAICFLFEAILANAQIECFPETNGECGEASRAIVGLLHGLSAYELDKVKRKKTRAVAAAKLSS